MKTFKVEAFFDKECFRWCAWGQQNCKGLNIEEDSFDKLVAAIKTLIPDVYETEKYELDIHIKETVSGPPEYKTAELCLKAVKRYGGYALAYVPEEYKTQALCLEAMKEDGWALQYVPDEYKTQEMCLEAVKQFGFALQFVPLEYKTIKLCLEAVKESCEALLYVPEALKTQELCLVAVKETSRALEYVPKELREEVRRRLESRE
jgi:hypothetical protein